MKIKIIDRIWKLAVREQVYHGNWRRSTKVSLFKFRFMLDETLTLIPRAFRIH